MSYDEHELAQKGRRYYRDWAGKVRKHRQDVYMERAIRYDTRTEAKWECTGSSSAGVTDRNLMGYQEYGYYSCSNAALI